MASGRYNSAKVKFLRGQFGDLHGATDLRATLHTSSYTPNYDSHDFYDDLTNELSTAGGYTAGGFTLANVTVAQDNTNDRGVLDADDIVIGSASVTFRYMVVRQTTGVASTSPLMFCVDFGSDVSASGTSLTIAWDSTAGVAYIA